MSRDETSTGIDQLPPRVSWSRRAARWVFLYAVVPYLAIVLIFAALQRRFLYPAERAASLRTANSGLAAGSWQDIEVQTDDGLVLHGWLALADGRIATNEQQLREELEADSTLVVYFPGNSGNRLERASDCSDFTALRCNAVLFDYRGYGDNPGSPSESAIAADAQAIVRLVANRYGVLPERLILFGESLGGAVAVRVAQELCEAGTPPAGLVLNSTFSSMTDTVRWHHPYFPVGLMLLDRYPSADRIRSVTCPILQMYGTHDDIVPFELARRLFDAAPEQSASGRPKQLVELPHAGHNDISPTTFRATLGNWLREVRAANGSVRSGS